MQLDVSPLPLPVAVNSRVAGLVHQFYRAVRRQRQHDTANLASLLRALQRGGPDAEMLCRLINLRGADAYAYASQAAAGVTRRSSDEDEDQG
jgi:hypothetical protein